MRVVRIWFTKTGLSRFISHLDLMRTMTRALRRSSVPLWYTEGFNPHPYLAFALPLSLGMESECESMDIKIEGEVTNEEVFSSLSAVMPDGLKILSVTDPVMDPKVISFGRFEIDFETEDPPSLKAKIDKTLSGSELIVQKLGKKGRRKVLKDVNLIEHIKSFSIDCGENVLRLSVTLPAGSRENINPELLAKKIAEEDGLAYGIKRLALLTEKLENFE